MQKNSQRGNAVVFILIAIALFGALAFTFMRSAKTGQGNLTLGQAKMVATEMISHTSAIERAVNKLLSRGCSENELNFYDPLIPTALNASAPSGNRCDIYNAAGGGVTANVFSTNASAARPSSGVNITGTASTNRDLIFLYVGINDVLCAEINKQLGLTNSSTIPVDATTGAPAVFTGTFAAGAGANFNDGDTRTESRLSACIRLTTGATNVFYAVLIDR